MNSGVRFEKKAATAGPPISIGVSLGGPAYPRPHYGPYPYGYGHHHRPGFAVGVYAPPPPPVYVVPARPVVVVQPAPVRAYEVVPVYAP